MRYTVQYSTVQYSMGRSLFSFNAADLILVKAGGVELNLRGEVG